jgi:drug/metabolite transporter (DMT)-like permease
MGEASRMRMPAAQPMLGASCMLGAGASFAIVNTMIPILTNRFAVPSVTLVFWQYFIATIFAFPLTARIGLGALKTHHLFLHHLRAFVVAAGVQAFAFGFASGVPQWQMVALSMTAPFFVIVGSTIFLGEKPTWQRLTASAVGFAGALACQQTGPGAVSWMAVLPILAAVLWAAATVLTKYLAREESAESLTLYMLLLVTPNHLLISVLLGLAVVALPPGILPHGLAVGLDLGLHGASVWTLVAVLGLITAISQYFLSLAYKAADAIFLQPFDDLKLPINVLCGWILLSQIPAPWFWPGASLILGASLFLLRQEQAATRKAQGMRMSVGVARS